MTESLAIRTFGQVPAGHFGAIASLPASLRLSVDGPVDIALVGPEVSSIQTGLATSPRILIVTEPVRLSEAAADLLATISLPVFVPLSVAASLRPLANANALAGAGLIRSRLGWQGSAVEGLFEHLAALETVLGAVADVAIICRSRDALQAMARTTSGVEIVLSGQSHAVSPTYELDTVGLDTRIEIVGQPDGTARPFAVSIGNVEGLVHPHGIYESGLRQFWREVVSGNGARQWRDVSRLLGLARSLLPTSANENLP